MANQNLVNYIRNNKSVYSVEKLKVHLLKLGYSQIDVNAAEAEAMGNAMSKIPRSQAAGSSSPYSSGSRNPFKITAENKPKLIDAAKFGAVCGAVAGAIIGIAGILSNFLVSLKFSFLAGTAGLIKTSFGFVSNIFWGAVWGALFGIILIIFYEKIRFNTLFKKVFYVRLTIDILFALLFSFGAIFTGALAYLVIFAGTIFSDFVYAKLFAKKMGELYGYA